MTTDMYWLTLGYQTCESVAELAALAAHYKAIVVDVRLNPVSSRPDFTKKSLELVLGPQHYVHIEEWGKVRKKAVIKNLAGGLNRLYNLLATQPSSVIIMCSCANYDVCHSKVLTETILEPLGTALERKGVQLRTARIWGSRSEPRPALPYKRPAKARRIGVTNK